MQDVSFKQNFADISATSENAVGQMGQCVTTLAVP